MLLEKAIVPYSSTLAWKIPWMEEPGGLQSMGSLWVRHDWLTSFSLFHFHALEEEMAPHSSVLAWRIPRTGDPRGLPSTGLHRVRHNWSDLAAAAAAMHVTFLIQSVKVLKIRNQGFPKKKEMYLKIVSRNLAWVSSVLVALWISTQYCRFEHYLS